MIDSLKMRKGYNIALHGIKESKGSKKIAKVEYKYVLKCKEGKEMK